MKRFTLLICAAVSCFSASAQYASKSYSKLIDDTDYKYIVGETSGEIIKNNAMDLSGYERYDRDFSKLWESEQLLQLLNQYGLEGAEIRRYPRAGKVWAAVEGSVWMVEPSLKKLVDIGDIPPALVANSCDADVQAELIWVGNATPKELEGLDLTGKIAVGDTRVMSLHTAVAEKGVAGVISIYNMRPFVDATQISNLSINAQLAKQTKTFAFQISPREGQSLITALKAGQKITVKAKVATKEVDMEYQSPTCYIAGSDPDAGEIIFSAHLFEGYTKLGANDNMSGSVVLLEVARSLNNLINAGLIEQPKRTLRFIWGDEFVGIIPWANESTEIMDKALFDINLDMVGISLSDQKSFYHLHRTTMANSHYANDLVENIFRYVGITNQNSILVGDFKDPVVAPTGSLDPFYYSLTEHYGASDHEVFNDWGIQVPAVMMITWPDENYHTSNDRVDKLDATQLKRAAVIASVVSYYAAIAGEDEALKIAGEVSGNALRRMATQHNKVSNELNTTKDLKHALYQIDAVAIAEKMTVASIAELAPESTKLSAYIATQQAQIDLYAQGLKKALTEYVAAIGGDTKITVSKLEREAASIYPVSTPLVRESGYGVLMSIFENTGDRRAMYMEMAKLNVGDAAEVAKLTRDGDKSILDIYKMVIAQTTAPADLQSMVDFIHRLEAKGLVTTSKKR
ncbi:MAG: M28 family peptidase [Rikenellaceae bacterium]